ncbi:hypothetical protein [Streptomyces canus]|uniref:hypothetical protein n=1 Tax=Streptomyces canus TaxID=58343 RepID=UPI003251D654
MFWLATAQWRYEAFPAHMLASPLGDGGYRAAPCRTAMRWPRCWAGCPRNPLDVCDEAERAGKDVPGYVVEELKTGRLCFTAEDPDDPVNFARCSSGGRTCSRRR